MRILFGLLLHLALGFPAHACSIYCPADLAEKFWRADYIFLARVAEVRQLGRVIDTGDLVDVVFDIEKSWKGDWGERPLRSINYDNGHCGGDFFRLGQVRVMFIDRFGNVGVCDSHNFRN